MIVASRTAAMTVMTEARITVSLEEVVSRSGVVVDAAESQKKYFNNHYATNK